MCVNFYNKKLQHYISYLLLCVCRTQYKLVKKPLTINPLLVSSDSIEDYIQTASSNVESANQELAKANQYQVQWPTPYCIHFDLFSFCVLDWAFAL